MEYLQACWRVIVFIFYMLRSEIGLFTTDSPDIEVPNPKIVAGSGVSRSMANTFGVGNIYSWFGGSNGYGGTGLINVPIRKYANASSGGRSILDFYYGLSNYMPTVTPITDPIRAIVANIAKWIYWIDIALQTLYTHLFGIMNMSGNHQYYTGQNFSVSAGATQGMSINDWFHASQEVGTVICIIMFSCYIIATMIAPSSQSWARFKNGVYCLFLGTGVICALPVLISFATYGANSVAQGALGMHQQGTAINSMANQFFYNNVYSIPHRVLVQGLKSGDRLAGANDSGNYYINKQTGSNGEAGDATMHGIMNQPNSYIYDANGHNSTHGIPGEKTIPVPLRIVNLEAMSPSEQNAWNGLRSTSITSWLNQYGTPSDVLNPDTLKELQNLHGVSVKKKNENHAVKSARSRLVNNIVHHKTSNADTDKAIYKSVHGKNANPGMFDWRQRLDNGRTANARNERWEQKHPKKAAFKNADNAGETVRVYHATQPNNNANQVSVYTPKNNKNSNNQLMTITQNHHTSAYQRTGSIHTLPSKTQLYGANGHASNTQQKQALGMVATPNNSASPAKLEKDHPNAVKKANKIIKKDHIKDDAGTNTDVKDDDIANLFQYHLAGVGPNAHLEKLTAFSNGAVSKATPAINHSYAMYKVSWANIFLGLIILAIVFIAFIFKLLDAFFEAFVMYGVMDIMIARDSDDPRKMKQWIRNFFNLYAMLAIDVVIIRLFFIAYFTVNNAVREIFLEYMPAQIGGNLTIMGMLQAICDIALMTKCLEGNQAINEALGRPTGAKNGWGHALAFMGGLYAAGRVGRGVSRVVSSAGLAGKGAWNGAFNAGHGLTSLGRKANNKLGHAFGIKGSNKNPIHSNGGSSSQTAHGLGVDNNTSDNSTSGQGVNPSSTADDNSASDDHNTGDLENNNDNDQPNNDDNVDLTPNGQPKTPNKPKKPNDKGDKFGNSLARKMSGAEKKSANKNGVKFTGENNAQDKAGNVPHGVNNNNDNQAKPLTANERATRKERNLRSKSRPVQATGDKFFNGITHIGNAGQQLFGGNANGVDHSTDAPFGTPGHLDNPTEDDGINDDTADDSADGDNLSPVDATGDNGDSTDDNGDTTVDPQSDTPKPTQPNDTGDLNNSQPHNSASAERARLTSIFDKIEKDSKRRNK